ncbi:MAG TPA: DNA mismatch repair endonuclease MutL [Thermoplasmata archaeon]|nr:DNA mismatch repair endonuclease MutL [Thermoplasmata archaeon]
MTEAELAGPRRAIHRLSPETVERIAAGEVVERPASVAKELVENAIDAGATEVRVHLVGGGLTLLRVDDDGVGIPRAELPLAVERHATSKLESADDLPAVATLGFRGEALASIGAVARLSVSSRVRETDEGYQLRVAGGAAEAVTVVGRPPGTTIEVQDLFFNTPARRKFLRSAASEQVEVLATLERMYLARPAVGIEIFSESGEIGRYPGVPSLRDAAARVFGPEFLAQSFEVDLPLPDGSRLAAVLGRPAVSRPSSQSLYASVNGRPVVSRPLAQAVRAAYLDYLPRGRFPVGVVALRVDPRRVDVNVHPTKREVRFADERTLFESVRSAVRASLGGQNQVAGAPEPRTHASGTESRPRGPLIGATAAQALGRGTARQRSLLEKAEAPGLAATSRHPALRLVGSLFSLYWVAESAGSLVLVDQHAASERVLFDALRRDGRLGRQELLHPLTLVLSPKSQVAFTAHAPEVRRAGFEIEPFGGDRVRVAAVPSYLGRRMPAEALRPLLDELAEGGRPTVPESLVDRVAASIACHAAVRAGDSISEEEMRRILEQLYALPAANYACPHGRPILVELPRGRLDRWFLRSGA